MHTKENNKLVGCIPKMSGRMKNDLVSIILIFFLVAVSLIAGLIFGRSIQNKKVSSSNYRYYEGTVESVSRNSGIVQIKANNRIYEIGYSDRIVDGSNIVLIQVDGNDNLVNVWNLAYNNINTNVGNENE